jgi:hypothetical protein
VGEKTLVLQDEAKLMGGARGQRFAVVVNRNSNSNHSADLALRGTSLNPIVCMPLAAESSNWQRAVQRSWAVRS